jgi:hypothetical protein
VVLDGAWYIHNVSLQNEDVAAGEAGMILLQWGTRAFQADRTWHPLEIGTTRAGAPMVENLGFVVRGTVLVVGQVDHVGADSHRVTVLAWKVRNR